MVDLMDLPREIVEHIVEMGCDDELLNADWKEPYPRERKRFASLARRVCSSWRDFIDLSRDGRFWIANLVLTLPTDCGYVCIARELLRFRRGLADSRGCDLIITFVGSNRLIDGQEVSSEQLYDIAALDKTGGINIRLFLYGMSAILPFQSQLVQIAMAFSQPQVDRYFCELLSSITHAPRLALIDFSNVSWKLKGENDGIEIPLLEDIKKVTPAPNWDREDQELGQPGTFLSLEHLSSLTDLSISNTDWLSEMKLPINISRLSLRVQPQSDFDLRKLATKPDFPKYLTRLLVQHQVPRFTIEGPPQDPGRTIQQSSFIFPCLRRIIVQGPAKDIQKYLAMEAPNVESVCMVLDRDQETRDFQALVYDIPFKTSPRFSFMTRLELCLKGFWNPFYNSVIKYFAHAPIRYLLLTWDLLGAELDENIEEKDENSLSALRPVTLELSADILVGAMFILENVTRTNLTGFHLHAWTESSALCYEPELSKFSTTSKVLELGTAHRREPELSKFSITSPHLKVVSFTEIPFRFIGPILSQLNPLALGALFIELSLLEEDDSQSQAPSHYAHMHRHESSQASTVDSFACSGIPIRTSFSVLRQYLDLAPNASRVVLDVGNNRFSVLRWPEGRTLSVALPSDVKGWYAACEALRPWDQGNLPFPNLTFLRISFPTPQSQSEKATLEEALPLFSEVFTCRASYGAPFLALKKTARASNRGVELLWLTFDAKT